MRTLRQTQLRHATYYKDTLAYANDLHCKHGDALKRGAESFFSEWQNIQAGQTWAAQFATGDRGAAQLCIDFAYAGLSFINSPVGVYFDSNKKAHWLKSMRAAACRLKDRRAEADALNQYINQVLQLATWERFEALEELAAIAHEIGDRTMEGYTYGHQGTICWHNGQVRLAIEFHEQMLMIAREIGDRMMESQALGLLGFTWQSERQSQLAIEFYKQELAILRETGDQPNEDTVLGNLGHAYFDSGETRLAVECFEQMLIIERKTGNRRSEEDILDTVGWAYLKLDEARRAIWYFEQALKIAREINYRVGESDHLSNLGQAYLRLGEVQHAIELCEQALEIDRRYTGFGPNAGCHLSNLGEAYAAMGEMQRAIEFMETAVKIFERFGSSFADWARKRLTEWQTALGEARIQPAL